MPTVSLDPERFSNTVAPASAWKAEGGVGTHRSSQISTPTTAPGSGSPSAVALKSRSIPNGTSAPPSRTVGGSVPSAGANRRGS